MREPVMKKTIILVSSEEEQLADLTDTLETHVYHATVTRSTDELETLLREHSSRVILLDLDAGRCRPVTSDRPERLEYDDRFSGCHRPVRLVDGPTRPTGHPVADRIIKKTWCATGAPRFFCLMRTQVSFHHLWIV